MFAYRFYTTNLKIQRVRLGESWMTKTWDEKRLILQERARNRTRLRRIVDCHFQREDCFVNEKKEKHLWVRVTCRVFPLNTSHTIGVWEPIGKSAAARLHHLIFSLFLNSPAFSVSVLLFIFLSLVSISSHLKPMQGKMSSDSNWDAFFCIAMLISGLVCWGSLRLAGWMYAAELNYIFIIVNSPGVLSLHCNTYLISLPVCLTVPTALFREKCQATDTAPDADVDGWWKGNVVLLVQIW